MSEILESAKKDLYDSLRYDSKAIFFGDGQWTTIPMLRLSDDCLQELLAVENAQQIKDWFDPLNSTIRSMLISNELSIDSVHEYLSRLTGITHYLETTIDQLIEDNSPEESDFMNGLLYTAESAFIDGLVDLILLFEVWQSGFTMNKPHSFLDIILKKMKNLL